MGQAQLSRSQHVVQCQYQDGPPLSSPWRADDSSWHIAIFCCNAKIGRNRGTADFASGSAANDPQRLTRSRNDGSLYRSICAGYMNDVRTSHCVPGSSIEADVDAGGPGSLPARPLPPPPHGESPACAHSLMVGLEHNTHGILMFQFEHLLQHVHHELHRRIVIVEELNF
jgi:hypothetical protein